jgi:uncharacterized membrane protein
MSQLVSFVISKRTGQFRVVAAIREYWMVCGVFLVGAIAFFGNPDGYTETSRAVLHGLCAQTPSHTIMFGDRPLPFDARMTGIYSGFLITVATIVGRGRLWRYGGFPPPILATLSGFVVLMAIDGINSLLTDMAVWHPYGASNAYRVVTGYGVGVALACGLAWLVASSAWHISIPKPPMSSLSELLPSLAGLAGVGLVVAWHPAWMHLPATIMLVLAAWLTITMLVLAMVLLSFRLDERIQRTAQLHVPVASAMLLAALVMIGLASTRFWIERTLGITNAMM